MAVVTSRYLSLEPGDHLTRDEFHRRYCQRPDIKKAELVEGVVHLAPPVRASAHGKPHGAVLTWLGTYQAAQPDVWLLAETTLRMDAPNEVQPNAMLFREEPSGPRLTSDDYVEGVPQLVVEVAASSASYDLHEKKEAYRRNGVREYVVWRTLDGAIDWFRLDPGGEYAGVEPDERGVIESVALPGLGLHVPKMLAGDMAGVLAELQVPPKGRRAPKTGPRSVSGRSKPSDQGRSRR